MAFPTGSAPSLANWSMQFNGLTVGLGLPWGFRGATGLDQAPIRSGDVPRPRDWGEFIGLDTYGGRDITLQLEVETNGTSLQSALDALDAAFQVGGTAELPLWIQVPNNPPVASMCRVRKSQRPLDVPYSVGGLSVCTIALHATDPRIYAPAQSATVGLGTPLGGLTFPITFPATFGGGSAAGIITAVNSGNVEMRPTFTITGPCTNPLVENATVGWVLAFSNPAQTSYTLNAGDELVVDTDLGSITYYPSGSSVGSSRRNWLVPGSIWPNQGQSPLPGLAPGPNTIEFSSADSTAVAGTLTFSWASAYASAI